MKILKKLVELTIRAAVVTGISIPFAKQMIVAAYKEREYWAIGGEWLVILMAAGALWVLSGYIIKRRKAHNDRRKESEEP